MDPHWLRDLARLEGENRLPEVLRELVFPQVAAHVTALISRLGQRPFPGQLSEISSRQNVVPELRRFVFRPYANAGDAHGPVPP